MVRGQFAVADNDEFARLDRTDEFGADDIEGDRFRRENIAVIELADDERADTERIAAAEHAFGGQDDQRIGALDLLQRVAEEVEQGASIGRRDERAEGGGEGKRWGR